MYKKVISISKQTSMLCAFVIFHRVNYI